MKDLKSSSKPSGGLVFVLDICIRASSRVMLIPRGLNIFLVVGQIPAGIFLLINYLFLSTNARSRVFNESAIFN